MARNPRTAPGLVTVPDGPDNGAMRLLRGGRAPCSSRSRRRPRARRGPAPCRAAASHGTPGHGWQLLEPGLELGLFDGPTADDDGRPIAIVRIDPARFELRLLNASAPGEGALRTARAWAERAGARRRDQREHVPGGLPDERVAHAHARIT